MDGASVSPSTLNPQPATLPVSFGDIEAARERIKGAVYYSPCPVSIPLSELTGMEIYCKLDNLQRT
ncbi:MAG: threonine ammonia-lyase, partial [Chthoniobacterales bacterium]